MFLSNSRKFIFIHITKAAGTSITHALEKSMGWNDLVIGSTPLLLAPDIIKLSPPLSLLTMLEQESQLLRARDTGELSRKRMRNPLKVGKHLNYHGELQI